MLNGSKNGQSLAQAYFQGAKSHIKWTKNFAQYALKEFNNEHEHCAQKAIEDQGTISKA